MKTRSRGGGIDKEDDRETETDESSYTNSTRRRRISSKVNDHLPQFGRNGLRRIGNHLSQGIKQEHENSRDTDLKSSLATNSSHSNSNEMFVNGGESIDEKQNVRRSTRQRKFTYDNLNQTWLLASSIPEFSKFESLFTSEQRSPHASQQCDSKRNQNIANVCLACVTKVVVLILRKDSNMVEVTRSNFSYVFPLVEKSIKESTFIAIDTEFTGLILGPSNESNLFDSLPERYEKLRCRATSFIPCQIGLSTFTKDKDKNSYSVETFVFYVRPCMIGSIDRIFTCQASAIDFLCGYNFDFKKFLPEGIPYINENEELQVREELKDGSISLPHEKIQDLRYQAKLYDMIDKKFGRYKYKPHVKDLEVTIPIHTKTHVYFQVKEIRRKFPKLWAYPQVDSILVKMVSPTERRQLQKYDEALEQEKVLDYYLGFTKVFRLLKNCQKPIVGHNILMDLMLLYQNFHQNLPDSYDKFKKELHSIFPIIYDTKHIWINISQVRSLKRLNANSGLTTLYELFKNPPGQLKTLYSPCILPSNCKQYVDEDFVHDSGYDAFITGFVFLKICHVLAMENSNPSVPMNNAPTFKHLLAAASSFVNKINFPYFSFKYVNLEGADPLPNKTNYLYICPKNPNENLTLVEFNMYFSRYETLEFKFKKLRKAAVVAIMNLKLYEKILKDFKDDPDLIVEEYNFLRHSPFVGATLWLTTVASACLVAAWIWKSR